MQNSQQTPDIRLTWGLLTLVLVAAAAVPVWLSNHSGFYSDDFIHLWQSKKTLTWGRHSLFGELFGHLIVTHRLAFRALALGSPPSWHKVQVMMAAANVLIALLAYRIGRVLTGHSGWAVGCAAVVGLGCYSVDAWSWCAAGIDYLAYAPFTLLGCELMVRRCLGGSKRLTLGIMVVLCLGLAGHERSAIMAPGFVFLAIALCPAPLHDIRHLGRFLLSFWDVWLVCLLTVSAFATLLFTQGYFAGQMPSSTGPVAAHNVKQVLVFIQIALTQTLVPGLVGMLPQYYPSPAVAMPVAWVILLALGVLTTAWLPRSGRVWLMLAAVCVANYLPIAIGRGNMPDLAAGPRYGANVLPFSCLAVALLGYEARRVARLTPRPALAHLAAPLWVAAGMLMVSLSTASTVYFQRVTSSQFSPSQRFTQAVTQLASGPDEGVLESIVPRGALRLGFLFGDTIGLISHFLSVVRPDVSMDTRDSPYVNTFQDDGTHLRFRRGAPAPLQPADLHVVDQRPLRTAAPGFCIPAGATVVFACPPQPSLLDVTWQAEAPRMITAIIMSGATNIAEFDTVASLASQRSATVFLPQPLPAGSLSCGIRMPAHQEGCFDTLHLTPLYEAGRGSSLAVR